ncbi:HAMP domain-containing protein [Rubrivivax benzoatilyticus]|uniref:HAMP domain-containing protein n=2 Tax=Rubrivivax benzoatilyticus TaxID=316997 RepID=A0ABX0HYV8_9BURK|nr:HAMP domain-containing protein [Rubrivivax benzoatilyticus]NHL25484.1 HAMP domain-containing protein [Rubrivivax benzoatilyticus]
MSFVLRLRIGARMALGFGIVVALMLIVLAAVLALIARAERANDELVGAQAERLALAHEWHQNIQVNSQRALAIGLTRDAGLERAFGERMKAVTERTTQIQKRYAELETSDGGRAGIEALAVARQRYLDQRKALLAAVDDTARRAEEGARFEQVTAAYIDVSAQVLAFQQQRQREISVQARTAMEELRGTAIVVSILAIVAAVAMGWTLTRGITRPLATLQAAARRIAGGDLAQPLERGAGQAETVLLSEEIANMQQALRTLVGQVHEVAESIEVASHEVAAGNADLSARTERTASSLEATASTMQSLTETVRRTAESARDAERLAHSAGDVARSGGGVVTDLVRSMAEIERSSRRVAEIIATIDGIAFQTNILALNAAVEAARAGDQGRGFAVVAGEVRLLAQRSADAAREIKRLIDQSVTEVEAGTRRAGDAGRSMEEIVAAVQRVGEVVDGISATTAAQSESIGGVNVAVVQIEQSTQQNAALVEQSTAAAASLREQAHRLTTLVGGFRLA